MDANPSVLIVEDDAVLRHLYQLILELVGYRIWTAPDGVQAWYLIQRHPPSAVLTDVDMPVMDGLTLCHQLKTTAATRHIPVLLMSARPLPLPAVRGVQADGMLGKPFEIPQLTDLLDRVLHRGTAATTA